jgi:hypothetical protein
VTGNENYATLIPERPEQRYQTLQRGVIQFRQGLIKNDYLWGAM